MVEGLRALWILASSGEGYGSSSPAQRGCARRSRIRQHMKELQAHWNARRGLRCSGRASMASGRVEIATEWKNNGGAVNGRRQ